MHEQPRADDELARLCGTTANYCSARSSPESFEIARQISSGLGPRVPVIERYLEAMSYAPPAHLRALSRRGTAIMFAPTIDAALTSDWAAERRGRELAWDEAKDIRLRYGPDSLAAGVYDSELDALIFPTAYRAKDLKEVVLHELAHALSVRRAQPREALLEGLPIRLQRHVFSDHYVGVTPEDTLRRRVLEALAEGYTYWVDGRLDELPAALLSELAFILQTVEESDQIRFEFETTPTGERTSSRRSTREIIDATDPVEGHTFAGMRLPPDAQAWDLAEDELAERRRRRGAA